MEYAEVKSKTEKQLEAMQKLLENPEPRNRAERRAQAKRNKKNRRLGGLI